ncbi:hypothetical protein [Neorhodopirellula lusitana]|uniref:hypothetical protein n=1 Tax=Neorhodopirellula lusitana TaxID=445327 RepID=UPI00384DFA9D
MIDEPCVAHGAAVVSFHKWIPNSRRPVNATVTRLNPAVELRERLTTTPNPYCPPNEDAVLRPRSIPWGVATFLGYLLASVSLAAFCFCAYVAVGWLYDSIVILESPELPLYFMAPVLIYGVALLASIASIAYTRSRKLRPWLVSFTFAVGAWLSVDSAVRLLL